MSTSVDFNGETHRVPQRRDTGWGDYLSALLLSLAQNALTAVPTLLAELDLGSTYGIRAKWFRSKTTNPADAGAVRLARADTVSWRNQAAGADLPLGPGTDDLLEFNGVDVADVSTAQTLLNKTVRNVKDDTRAYARYTRGSAQAMPNGGVYTIVDFATSVLDSRSAVTTGASWKFTVPTGMGGVYLVSAEVHLDSIASAGQAGLALYKNGSVYTRLGSMPSNANNDSAGGSALISLVAGDYIDVRLAQNSSTGDRNITNDATLNHISILRMVTDL